MVNENQEIRDIEKRLYKLEAQIIFIGRRMDIQIKEATKWSISPKILG